MDTIYPLTPTLSPKDLQEVEVFGGEGETRGDLDPGQSAEFLLRTLPWATVCCPFRALMEDAAPAASLFPKKCPISRAIPEGIAGDVPVGVCRAGCDRDTPRSPRAATPLEGDFHTSTTVPLRARRSHSQGSVLPATREPVTHQHPPRLP